MHRVIIQGIPYQIQFMHHPYASSLQLNVEIGRNILYSIHLIYITISLMEERFLSSYMYTKLSLTPVVCSH
jgi:hypothetical protein